MWFGLPTQLAHPFQDEFAVAIHVFGVALQGPRQDCSEPGGLFPANIEGRGFVVVAARPFRAINPRAPFDDIEVELQNALLTEDEFGHRNKRELGALAEDGAAGSEEQVLNELLRQSGASTKAATLQIVFSGDFRGLPIESTVLVEARILRGDHGVLEIGRNLAQWNELVSFVIGLVANPGLQTALHVNRGRWWVDPTGRHKEQNGNGPKKRRCDEKPSSEGSQREFASPGLGVCIWILGHISE